MQSGQKKKVVILNVDMLKLEVHVSLCHDLVNRKTKKVSLPMTLFPWFERPYTLLQPTHFAGDSNTNAWVTVCLGLYASFPVMPFILV